MAFALFLVILIAATAAATDQALAEQPEIDLPTSCKGLIFCTESAFSAENKTAPAQWGGRLLNRTVAWPPGVGTESGGRDDCVTLGGYETLTHVRNDSYSGHEWYPLAYEQRVYMERCESAGALCFTRFEAEGGQVARCVQQTAAVKLRVMVDGKSTTQHYNLPTYCTCQLCKELN